MPLYLSIESLGREGSAKMKKVFVWEIICSISGFLINLLGGWDVWLAALMGLMVTDVAVGLIKSLLCRSDKSESGALNAASMFRGGVKKILILVVIALATLLDDVIIPGSTNIRSVTAGYYIANEALSVIENIGACGVPLPKVFFKVLDSLKKDEDD